jgi:hypothetical protein
MDHKYNINNRLIDIILDNIDYDEYKINEDEKKWINRFINESYETFIELDTDIQTITITEDRFIRIDDIPTIIKIITDSYLSSSIYEKSNKNAHYLSVLIKYTLLVILDTELLILPTNVSKENVNNIVDSSMILLNMNLTNCNKNNEVSKSCSSCRYSCFDSIRNLFSIKSKFYYKTT